MPRKLSNYRLEHPKNYTLLPDSNAANLILAMPFTKEHGLRDISHLIRGSGGEYTSFTYNKISDSHIVGHESCFYDSCLRFPHTPYTNVLNIGTNNLPNANDNLGTGEFTIEWWMKFDSFDFDTQFDICYPASIDNVLNNDADVPYIFITGDGWPTASQRRGIQVRGTGATNGSTVIIANTTSILSPKIWYHIAITRSATNNTFRICVGSRETTGVSPAIINNIPAGNNMGNAGNTEVSVQNTYDFDGVNYLWFSRQFNTGRMPVGVYVQDFRFYRGVAKYITSVYKTPDPILAY